MKNPKKRAGRRPSFRAARNVHRPRGGGARRLELQGLRGSALDLLREKSGWRKQIPADLAYRVVQEEYINDHLHFLEKFIETGKLPDDWARDFSNVEWFLCDYPIQLVNVPFGLMEAERALAYRARDPNTRPPIILDFSNQIMQGRHRVMSAFLRGETSILAYIPQRVGTISPLVQRYRIGATPVDVNSSGLSRRWSPQTHGRWSRPVPGWSPPRVKTI